MHPRGWRGKKHVSAKIKLNRIKQPAFLKLLLQDSFYNYTNTNIITGIIKCVFHFSAKMCIISYCVWPDGDDEKLRNWRVLRLSKTLSVKNLLLLKFAGHPPTTTKQKGRKEKKNRKKELFNVCFWFLWYRKGKGQWKCAC